MSGNLNIGGTGAIGGWKAAGIAGGVGILIFGAWFMLDGLGERIAPPPAQPRGPVGVSSAFPTPPPPPPPLVPQQVLGQAQPAVQLQPPPTLARRPRPSQMVLYDTPTPVRPTPRPSAPGAAPEPDNIAGIPVMRAQLIQDPQWWLMPGDKIPCENLEPITARTGARFSANVPFDVRGRTGNRTLVPKGSRVVGTVVKGLENGQERLVAVMTHVEGPSVEGRPTVIAPLGDAQAGDVIGQVDLEGNVNTHFWSRLAAVGAYAALDLVSTAGGAIAGAAISDAVSGATGGRNGGVGIVNLQGMGRSLAGQEYQTQMQRPPSFERPQGQACTVTITRAQDFRVMKAFN